MTNAIYYIHIRTTNLVIVALAVITRRLARCDGGHVYLLDDDDDDYGLYGVDNERNFFSLVQVPAILHFAHHFHSYERLYRWNVG